ncbi:spermidine/putrescine ABC transporter substrate-binding protein [Burkholderia ubonensis]|uniref:Putrescine-binding periplasmic protein n=1 Tax=Burkholderia ubonensis TaxID=101571 RepID=A0AB73G327_9BURK|nr:polyamine ABC transporter substrate-binding protein [Burkholderia ubonensis]KVC72377.1 spermidine/putrescine ABC transporter substrate-binding protein [Burkholderia ubonensis]KVD19159.1 spermidine/putrescine ABC transporter substrate-binding protein [Burkholderia ubonensis]KVG71770.1 spermidine/putrescine ABC transporter substrate-binding protein [Burkholderia ubonensis]KVH17841.1 spermidine/putrescine ABC transporter substrate-binding protein [Burkholderia ubonensis]KVH42312.1 spermidine/p
MKRIGWIVVALASLACPVARAADDNVLNVYNWAEYFAPDTIAGFEKETGIKVRLDVYDSNESLQTKLSTGNSGYDLVFPSNDFLARQIQAGLYQKLDKSKLPNLKNLDPAIVARAAEVDPGNEYSVPYMQGTFGLGLNVRKVRDALGGPLPVNTLDLIFNPAYASKLKACGIAFNDAGSEVFPLALRYIGRDPNTTDPRDYEAALDMMKKIRPTIRQFIATPVMNDLATGEVCVVTGYSGAVLVAALRAADAKNGQQIVYNLPSVGASFWFDSMAIPKGAAHANNALRFIDYILRPDVVAKISNKVMYPNPNRAATPLVDKRLTADPAIYPDTATMRTLWVKRPMPPQAMRMQTRYWTQFKTGR